MPTLAEFSAQLERCAQSEREVRDFIEAFSKVRLRSISRALAAMQAPEAKAVVSGSAGVVVDWQDAQKLAQSGLYLAQVQASKVPASDWLHIDTALDPASRAEVDRLLALTCLSDKQRRALFPALSAARFATAIAKDARSAEVVRLNDWLDWTRREGIAAARFGEYQKHLSIHGASQNAGGDVGAVGGAIAVVDALLEICPNMKFDQMGVLPPGNQRDPVSVDAFLRREGIFPESKERPLKSILLPNKRAIIFASDPDIAIIQSLGGPFHSPLEAWKAYAEVRNDSARRAQRIVEFAVGEIKAATDASNLHERLALSTRENRSERQTDRFLMMAILTKDLLVGSSGKSGRRSTRAPMQGREMGRMADVFNLHHAWGWDGGRVRHADHWLWFKRRLGEWCGL